MESKFFKIIVHDESSMPTLLGICVGFENGEWRGKRLADNLFNSIPDFCLSYSETHEVDSVEWMDKIRKDASQAIKDVIPEIKEHFFQKLICVTTCEIVGTLYWWFTELHFNTSEGVIEK